MSASLSSEDLALLRELRANARLSNRELAARCGLSHPSVASHLKRLEEQGVIKGYSVVLDDASLGLGVEGILRVRVAPAAQGAFLGEMRAHAAVVECARVSGHFTHVLWVRLPALADLAALAQDLGGRYGEVESEVVYGHEIRGRVPLPPGL
ncbi:MAG: Lrp/AsnC family transcriptional regulator [Succinivibrionaceae bacterium]|nr:Lrp/AsnC family transcriptional regulator [Succinivibrionaceae bacterium]